MGMKLSWQHSKFQTRTKVLVVTKQLVWLFSSQTKHTVNISAFIFFEKTQKDFAFHFIGKQESSVQRPSKRQKIHGGRLVNVPGCRQQQSKAEDSGSRPKGGFLFHACDGVRGKREVAIEHTRVPLFQIIQAISRVAEERPLRSEIGRAHV